MSEPVSFNAERALRMNDNRMWSAADMLRALLQSIEKGEINPDKMMVVYWENSEDDDPGAFSAGSALCNVSVAEEFAMLELEKESLMERWRCG